MPPGHRNSQEWSAPEAEGTQGFRALPIVGLALISGENPLRAHPDENQRCRHEEPIALRLANRKG